MLSRLILGATWAVDRAAIVTPSISTTWRALREETERAFSAHDDLRRRRVGLSLLATAEGFARLAALERLECDVFLLDARLAADECLQMADRLRLGAVVRSERGAGRAEWTTYQLPNEAAWSGSSSLTILTSGSTGTPKAARHSWEGIARPIRRAQGSDAPRWLLTYRPHLYAGLQVMLQCFADLGTLAVPDFEMDPSQIARFMRDAGVQFVSATPSYFRRLLMFAEQDVLTSIPLKQITLGGEVVDQAVLNRLRNCYPNARLVHIYATTELGRCFSVSDKLAGFPVSYLNSPLPDGPELKVADGELLVRSPNAMRMYDPLSMERARPGEWFETGDLVQVKDDRVYFVGRRSEMINVAGSKVYPAEVEHVLRAIAGVADVRVFGKTSSIAGELVACEIVASPGCEPSELKETISRTCRNALASHQQPRIIRFVDHIDISSAGKTLRKVQ
jgi:acyl-CoA synthetase (AMP-forming)/AMP-acid ligase II